MQAQAGGVDAARRQGVSTQRPGRGHWHSARARASTEAGARHSTGGGRARRGIDATRRAGVSAQRRGRRAEEGATMQRACQGMNAQAGAWRRHRGAQGQRRAGGGADAARRAGASTGRGAAQGEGALEGWQLAEGLRGGGAGKTRGNPLRLAFGSEGGGGG